jgi:hypothetical protein
VTKSGQNRFGEHGPLGVKHGSILFFRFANMSDQESWPLIFVERDLGQKLQYSRTCNLFWKIQDFDVESKQSYGRLHHLELCTRFFFEKDWNPRFYG